MNLGSVIIIHLAAYNIIIFINNKESRIFSFFIDCLIYDEINILIRKIWMDFMKILVELFFIV